MAVKGKPQQQLEQKNMKTLHVTKPIHRSLLLRTLLVIAPALVIIAVLTPLPARATPSCGVITVDLLHPSNPPNTVQPTTFLDGLLDLTCNEINTLINGTLYNWNLKLKAKGDSDLYVTQHTFPVGAHTGWHTHPGPSLITVVSGALTVYEASDPTCTPKIYTAGQSFTDIGCGDIHLVRNEGSVIAQDVAVQIVPKGTPRRIDVTPAPSNCPLISCP
jgi:quercetin dioxygenase-like cupin family protein